MSPRINRSPGLAVALVVLTTFVLAVYLWVGPMARGPFTSRTGELYYPALADAFLAGQLHLKIPPDPRLNELEKGWKVVPDGIPRLPEAVYYQGRYYLYFSALPALIFFVPVRWVFGVFPSDLLATFVFCLAGWIVAAGLLVWAWSRWFAGLSRLWLGLGLLLMAFTTRTIFLLQAPMVHCVPISCAFFCAMLALAGVVWTLVQTQPRRQALGLALVSLTWAGAVACRPNYIFSLPAVGLPWLHLLRSAYHAKTLRPRLVVRLTAAALLPAMAIGVALLAYNYARFGQLSEFGVRYHVGAIDGHDVQIFGLSNLWPNWRTFFLAWPGPPYFSAYFPFFPGWDSYWGILYSSPFIVLVLGMPLLLLRTPWCRDALWVTVSLTLLAAVILNSLSILLLTLVVGVAERYVVDFLPYTVLLSILTALGLLADARRSDAVWRYRLLVLCLVTVGGAGLINSGLSIAIRSAPVDRLPSLARAVNALVAKQESAQGTHYGPMTLQLRFQGFEVGRREALLVSGNGRDIVYVDYLAPDRIRLGLDHRGSVNLASDPLPITPGRDHVLELDLGSLYPPPEHPFFAGVPVTTAHALRHRLTMRLDGTTVLQLGCVYYPTQPSDIFLTPAVPGPLPPFSGTVNTVLRPGRPALETLTGPGLPNPARLTVILPRFHDHHSEPLVSSGAWGLGDLLYVTYVAPGKIRFGHDNHGAGSFESAVVDYAPETPVTIDLDLPSLRPGFDGTRPDALRVRLADQLIIDDPRPFHPTQPYEVFLGFNGADSSQAGQLFQGRILNVAALDGPFIPAPDEVSGPTGPLRLTLRLPPFSGARSEPLLVTGVTGAADAIYVQYLDADHIRIGYDHWGTGGALSPPIAIQYGAFHVVELSVGSLFPEPADHRWDGIDPAERLAAHTRVSVRLNEETVLTATVPAYPTQPDQVRIGQNVVGLSTCDARFTGQISGQEWLGFHPPP